MMPTMQEIDDTEEVIRKVLLLSHPDLSMRLHYLTEAARRGVEENSAQDELNRIVDYIMGYWPAGFCYSHPLQAVTVLAGEMQRTQQRAEQLEAELAALKVERDEAVRREREACADACIEIADSLVVGQSAAFRCAEAIRARADQGGPADIGEAGCAHGLIPDNHADAAGDQSGPHPTEGGKS